MALENGATFAGYTVRRLLGSGGMGEVYLVDHPRLPRLDAMKVLRETASANAEFRTRFEREANIAAGLWHPHIVGLHDRGEFDGRLWISMDYVAGTDAAQLVKHQYPNGLPLDLVVAIVKAVGSALDYAHQRGLLHRDIKPANILLSDETGGERRILLSDFGIARQINEVSSLTATHLAIGTVSYSAPEQLMGGEIDGRADQYSLAATAFRLLTAQVPYQDSNQVAVISQHLSSPPPPVSSHHPWLAPLDAVLMKAMAKTADERFDNCTQFAREFERCAAEVVEPPSSAVTAHESAPAEPVASPQPAVPAVPAPPVVAPEPEPTPEPTPQPTSQPAAPPQPPLSVEPVASVEDSVSVLPPVVVPPPVSEPAPADVPPLPNVPTDTQPRGRFEPPVPAAQSAPQTERSRPVRPPQQGPHHPTVVLPTVPPAPPTSPPVPPQSTPRPPYGPSRQPVTHGPSSERRFDHGAPPPISPLPRIAGPEIGRPAVRRNANSKPWLVGLGAAAVVAAVVTGGVALFSGDDSGSPTAGPETSSSSTTSGTPTLKLTAPPQPAGVPGSFPTIATYLHEVSPNVPMTHRHDPGAPIITLPLPPNWSDAGTATRPFAYQTIVYHGPGAETYAPSVTALMSKLGPDVDPQKIIDNASGELNNMPGFAPIDRGGMRIIDGRQAFRLSGTWNAPAVPPTPGAPGTPDTPGLPPMQRLIAQYTVLIQDRAGLYVLQINVDAEAGQNEIFQQICDAIDRDTKIATS